MLPNFTSYRSGLVAIVWLAGFGVAASTTLSAAEPLTLERQLQSHAPEILARLRQRQCRRVGVLKFRVEKPGRGVSDNAGTLNQFLAQRLEVALALAIPTAGDNQIQLVRNASAIAAKIPHASHLSPVGRSLLFKQDYPAAWGSEVAPVDAFVTGVAQFAPDNKSFTLGILAVRPGDAKLELLVRPLQVATNGTILHEAGDSFQVRGVAGRSKYPDAAQSSLDVRRNPQANFPLQDNPAVVLRILYDREPVKLTFAEGEARIPEPRTGQKVWLQLERMDRGDVPLGVVLKLNGENTLYRERLRDVDCAKWVLTREKPKGTIRGFEVDNNEQALEFRVAPREESKGLEMYYGPDVGTISMVVFSEATAAVVPPRGDNATEVVHAGAPDLVAIAKAQFPDEPRPNAEELTQQLRSAADNFTTRGVIMEGAVIAQRVQTEDYDWHPEPIMSAVIRYYRPK